MPRTAEQKAAHAANMRAWRAANPEKAAASDKRKAEALRTDPERMAKRREYHNKYNKRYRLENAERMRELNRNSYIRCTYGIEPEEYNEMLAKQGGHCAICPATEPGGGKLFFPIDHCHQTGRNRGLLCDRCNRALGLFGDDPDVLEAAARYLRR